MVQSFAIRKGNLLSGFLLYKNDSPKVFIQHLGVTMDFKPIYKNTARNTTKLKQQE